MPFFVWCDTYPTHYYLAQPLFFSRRPTNVRNFRIKNGCEPFIKLKTISIWPIKCKMVSTLDPSDKLQTIKFCFSFSAIRTAVSWLVVCIFKLSVLCTVLHAHRAAHVVRNWIKKKTRMKRSENTKRIFENGITLRPALPSMKKLFERIFIILLCYLQCDLKCDGRKLLLQRNVWSTSFFFWSWGMRTPQKIIIYKK